MASGVSCAASAWQAALRALEPGRGSGRCGVVQSHKVSSLQCCWLLAANGCAGCAFPHVMPQPPCARCTGRRRLSRQDGAQSSLLVAVQLSYILVCNHHPCADQDNCVAENGSQRPAQVPEQQVQDTQQEVQSSRQRGEEAVATRSEEGVMVLVRGHC